MTAARFAPALIDVAGRRHHILPRFLLKGFAHETRGDQAYVWYYSRHRAPVPTNVINVAVEGDFYGQAGSGDYADPALTASEPDQARLVDQLRSASPGPTSDPVLGLLMAQLTSRTKHLRLGFAESAGHLLEALRSSLHEEGSLERLLLRQMEDREWLQAQVTQSLAPEFRTPEIVQATLPLIQALAPRLIAYARPQLAHFLGELIDKTRDPVTAAATSGQLRALLRLTSNSPKAEFFNGLAWRTEACDRSLVLGDSAALFQLQGEDRLRPYPEDLARIRAVYLPLSSDRLLFGSVDPSVSTCTPAQLIEATVRCSRDFFVSAQAPATHEALVAFMGTDAMFFSREQIDELVLALLRQERPNASVS